MSQTADTMIERWISNPKNLKTRYANGNIFSEGDTLYSYGYHFKLGILIRNSDGGITHAVLNGNTYSPTTTRHQSATRGALRRAGIQFIIVPFESLGSAGVKPESIRPIDVKGDTFEYTRVSSVKAPESMTTADLRYRSFGDNWDDQEDAVGRIGGQLVKLIDGHYVWHTVRHWLGDSVFSATVDSWRNGYSGPRDTFFISSFDRQERGNGLYFLSELPREPRDFDDAIESLKPEAVVTAESMGREVTRQGDMFAIPTEITTNQLKAMGAAFTKRTGAVSEWIENEDGSKNWRDLDFEEGHQVLDFTGDWDNRRSYVRHNWDVYRAPLTFHGGKLHRHRVVVSKPEGHLIYGTAHTATEVAVLPDGTTLARGSMYHHPWQLVLWREADHARRKMGDGKAWHVIARNTVPTAESVASTHANAA